MRFNTVCRNGCHRVKRFSLPGISRKSFFMVHSIAINTLAFRGYPWDRILEETARLPVEFVEPVFISKYAPELREDYFTAKNAQAFLRQATANGLKVRSVASHMDMGRPDCVAVFEKRMAFARAIGAGIILTNTTAAENERQFLKHMKALCHVAEDLELMIGLENPGDGAGYLINNAADGVRWLERLGSERLKLNFDFSNVFTLSAGRVSCDPGLAQAIPHIGHLHLKNVGWQNGAWRVTTPAEGVIDYKTMFEQHPQLSAVPASLELPLCYGYNKEFEFVMLEKDRLPAETILQVLQDSLRFMNGIRMAEVPER